MCENCDGRFAVPIKRSAGMGWWVGRIISADGRFVHIDVLWVENPEHRCVDIHSTPDYIREFSEISDAIEYLSSQGVKEFIPSPKIEIGY